MQTVMALFINEWDYWADRSHFRTTVSEAYTFSYGSQGYTGKCATCVKHAFLKRMFHVRFMHGKRVNRVTHV